MTKDWFKYPTAVYEKEDKFYLEAKSSFFDKFIFSWQRIASKMYPMGGQWMIEARQNGPESMLEMNKIKNLTTIYDPVTHILEELICGCYFDDIEAIVGAIMSKEYHDMEEHDYCEKLLKLCEEFEDKHNKLEDVCKEKMKE